MAFHVACPITCKRICFCALGFPGNLKAGGEGTAGFWEEIAKVDEFFKDPWFPRVNDKATVQVPVPKVVPPAPAPPPLFVVGGASADRPVGTADGSDELLSAQTKRAALQKRAAVASMAAEDYARKFESGALLDSPRDVSGEEQSLSNVNIMCRLCFSGESEGSERAKRMFSCKSCNKKYHRGCLKTWAQHRDLFHWSSWTCPSCRLCEVCHRTGDPSKFKFCRRCDAAYHCYCMQPPHKNISSGPYLCPNHTRCHSCGSTVPGNGLSLRWFLAYTCCDACGRLFTKGNYCPVCLRVYRDSESTPMVCCDICQRWVHCQCDAISDEKYLQFQADGNLPYTCPTCRGECYQVKDLEDAVRELWRRRDEADQDLIAELRSAAGLPIQDEIFAISPFSDDEDDGPFGAKNEIGRAKTSLKSLAESSPKKSKEYGKKSSNKKHVKKKEHQMIADAIVESRQNSVDHQDDQTGRFGNSNGQEFVKPHGSRTDDPSEGTHSNNQHEAVKQKSIDDLVDNDERKPGILQIKGKTSIDAIGGQNSSKSANKKPLKATKLVIHLGGRNRNIANSPKSDSSSYLREQESLGLNGGEAISNRRESEKHTVERFDSSANLDEGDRVDSSQETRVTKHREREGNFIRLKGKSTATPKSGGCNSNSGNGILKPEKTPLLLEKGSTEGSTILGPQNTVSKGDRASLRKHPDNSRLDITGGTHNKVEAQAPVASHVTPKDSKPLLKLKFKNPYQGSWVSHGEEEKGSVKGQRSKRKRPSPKGKSRDDENGVGYSEQDSIMNEIMDANWILKKLGKDAVGKRVEVHQQTDNSWHKGVVSDLIEGTSILSVDLDDGRTKTLELGKQGIRFVPQKQKKLKH